MKYIIILGDGMADRPIASLGGKTPLMVANKPAIDELARKGKCGMFTTVPSDMPAGSEVANLGVMGYNVYEIYEGRGVLEAASMGVEIGINDLAMRCNILTIENEAIKNHSAGHISNEEAHELIQYLDENLGNEKVKFYPGVSYRHLLVIKNGNKELECAPPHDHPNELFMGLMVKPLSDCANETAVLLNNMILESQKLLENHPINIKRREAGKEVANSIWPWSPGYKPKMKTYKELFGIESAAVISAVDLIQGIGVYAGMEVIKVEGATGLYNTNYEGKAQATIDALATNDFVYLHIEASDEAGHEGDIELKIKTIEYLDNRVVRTIVDAVDAMDEPVTIAILPDHPTPCELRTHVHDPIPFLIYRKGIDSDEVPVYDEVSCQKGGFGLLKGDEFIKAFFDK